MLYHATRSGNKTLVKRLNKFPLGVIESGTLYEILKTFVTEKEAGLLSLYPLKPFIASKAAKIWKMRIVDAHHILNELCDKTMLVDIENADEPQYVLPPPMAGFIKFSLMRLGNDRNQKDLAKLCYHT